MPHRLAAAILAALVLVAAFNAPATACSSFMLETDDGIYFAHSLNMGSMDRVNGRMHINPRGLWKRGYDTPTMMGQTPDAGPTLIWQAKYGSVTNSPLGRENPDGGMNEAGLFIWEMGYCAEYSTDPMLPVLFQMQWMQYQLDNYATVAEVVENAGHIALDGWGWHYFIADATGDAAIIDHANGEPVIYRGETLPIPVCCNSNYEYAMDFLSQHEGFGGDIPITHRYEETSRFITGARLLREYDGEEPVQYCLDALDAMSVNVRWSTVFDLNSSTVHFTTNINKTPRHFSFSPVDFEPGAPTLTLDMNADGAGDVRSMLEPHDPAPDVANLAEILTMFLEDEELGRQAAEAHVERLEYVDLAEQYDIAGTWAGTVTASVKGEEKSFQTTLTIEESEDGYAGVVEGEAFSGELPLHNIEFDGGLLAFTSRDPESGELIRYQLHLTGAGIRGGAWTWDWWERKVALLDLVRS